jgi:hypothetical protein
MMNRGAPHSQRGGHVNYAPPGSPVKAFDGKASVMTQNRREKESETIKIHAKVSNLISSLAFIANLHQVDRFYT